MQEGIRVFNEPGPKTRADRGAVFVFGLIFIPVILVLLVSAQ